MGVPISGVVDSFYYDSFDSNEDNEWSPERMESKMETKIVVVKMR